MPVYWFQRPSGAAIPFQCGTEGIHIPSLAAEMKLKPRPLKLNGVVVDFNRSTGYLALADATYISGLGNTPESAIPVDGQPTGATGATEGGIPGSKREQLNARLEQLAASMQIPPVQEQVVYWMIDNYAAQLEFANNKRLAKLYNKAAAAPLTSTMAFIKHSYNLVFSDCCRDRGGSSRSILLLAFRDGAVPKLVKFKCDYEDIKREGAILDALWRANPCVPNIVGPVRTINSASESTGTDEPEMGARAVRPKIGLEMPVYPATLAQVPVPVNSSALLRLGKQLKEALDGMHGHGYVHNDIKAPNVFLTADGDGVLGDFGAAGEIGTEPLEMTVSHWPGDVDSDTPSSAATDYFLLAVTLLERAGLYQLRYEPPPTTDELLLAVANVEDGGFQELIRSLLAPMQASNTP